MVNWFKFCWQKRFANDWLTIDRQWPILQIQLKYKSIIFSSTSNAVHRKQWIPIGYQANHRQIIPPNQPQLPHHSITHRP